MGDTISKYHEMVEDGTIKKEKTIDGLGVIEVFETEYPELAVECKSIQSEMYEMLARRQMDYG